jgi:hypothetical protein
VRCIIAWVLGSPRGRVEGASVHLTEEKWEKVVNGCRKGDGVREWRLQASDSR